MTIADLVRGQPRRNRSAIRPTSASSATCAPPSARWPGSRTCSRARSTSARRRRGSGWAGLTRPGPRMSRLLSPDMTVDYCSGCGWCTHGLPGRREGRGDEQPVAGPDEGGQAAAPARLGARPDRPDRPDRRAVLAARQLVARAIGPSGRVMEVTFGIDPPAPLPRFSGGPSGRAGSGVRSVAGRPRSRPDRAVVYFHGCAVNYYEPHVGRGGDRTSSSGTASR